MSKQPIPIQVVTRKLEAGDAPELKQIDYANPSDRKWLMNHIHYCVTDGQKSVIVWRF